MSGQCHASNHWLMNALPITHPKTAVAHAMPRRFPKVPRPQWTIFEGIRLRFSGTQGKERMVKTQLRLVNL